MHGQGLNDFLETQLWKDGWRFQPRSVDMDRALHYAPLAGNDTHAIRTTVNLMPVVGFSCSANAAMVCSLDACGLEGRACSGMVSCKTIKDLYLQLLVYSELKNATSSPSDFIGFDRLERSETTPRLTSMLRKRPSHMSDTSYI
jgi:hypothetical protein